MWLEVINQAWTALYGETRHVCICVWVCVRVGVCSSWFVFGMGVDHVPEWWTTILAVWRLMFGDVVYGVTKHPPSFASPTTR